MLGHAQAGGAQALVGFELVDGDAAAGHARAVVGQAELFQLLLQGAVLAGPAVQGNEHLIGQLGQLLERDAARLGQRLPGVGAGDGAGLAPDALQNGVRGLAGLGVLNLLADVVGVVLQHHVHGQHVQLVLLRPSR